MAFGNGFKHEDSKRGLDCGVYENAVITSCEIKTGSFGDYIQGTVSVDGDKDIYPNIFLLNDSPTQGYGQLSKEDALKIWNQQMTKVFASFGIPEGNFDVKTWIGKKGTITVRNQKKKPEYKEIVLFKTKFETKTEEKTKSDGDLAAERDALEDKNFDIF